MVKRRGQQETSNSEGGPTSAQVEAFAAAADQPKTTLNPNANRDYKAIRVPFNEYEYKRLEMLAAKTGRTKLNAVRWAILKLAEEVEKQH